MHFNFTPYNYILNSPISYIDLFGLYTLSVQTLTSEEWRNFNSNEDVLAIDAVDISPSGNNSNMVLGDLMGGALWGVNTAVGGVSMYTVHSGKYYKWNEIWHQTKTRGTAWRWQSRWNKGVAPRIRAEQVKSVSNARNLSGKLTKVGGVLLVADVALSGQLKPSHAINAAMLGASTTGVGAIAAGAWFIVDFGAMGVNYIMSGEAKGLGDMIDEATGTYQMYDGLY